MSQHQHQQHGKSVGLDPWLLWGSTQTLQVAANANPPVVQAPQLANVDYHHPTTWRFMLVAKAAGYIGTAPATSVIVEFDVRLGVGRSNVYLGNFCQMELPAIDFTSLTYGQFCTAVDAPAPVPAGVPVRSQRIDVLPAQSIQCTGKVTAGPSPGTIFQVELSAFFAPATHIRPEWFAGDFGTELGGR
jgi:hypothetical protein